MRRTCLRTLHTHSLMPPPHPRPYTLPHSCTVPYLLAGRNPVLEHALGFPERLASAGYVRLHPLLRSGQLTPLQGFLEAVAHTVE
jgi:hypothetical protein